MALDHFAQLASFHELPDFPIDIFFSATRCVIHAASGALSSILETNMSLNRLEVLHDLMRFVIDTSFLVLLSSPSESFGYLLFNQLSGLLLSPVIHSFFPLSIKSLGYLLEPVKTNPSDHRDTRQKSPDLHVDRRPKLLEFFQNMISGLFSALCSLAKTTSGDRFRQDASSMRDMLILETIRHLKGILSPISVDNHNPDTTSDEIKKFTDSAENMVDPCSVSLETYLRVRQLAVKDAMWYLCSILHILIGSRTPDILSSVANSDRKSIEDMDQMQRVGSEISEKTISRELFELLIDTRLHQHEKSRLLFGAFQIPVGSLSGTDIARTAVRTVKKAQELHVTSEGAGSHRNAIQPENPTQQTLNSNEQANCFETNYEIDTRVFNPTDCPDSDKISMAKRHNMHHDFDDAERGMLFCVVERYVYE